MFHPAAGNCREEANPEPTVYSQERQQDDTQSSSTRKLVRGEDVQTGRPKMEFHNMQVSDHRNLEKVFEKLRKIWIFAEEAPIIDIEALKTNVLILGLSMSTTMKAAIHLGPTYVEYVKYFKKLRNSLDMTQKLILHHQAETLNVTPIDWTALSWERSTLSHDQVITWTKARIHVHSDSVLCLENMQDHSAANRRWDNPVGEFRQSNSC